MFDAISHAVLTRARTILALTLITLILAGALGAGAFARLRAGGFDDAAAEASRAAASLHDDLGQDGANLVLLVTAPPGVPVDDPAVERAGREASTRLDAQADVTVLTDYWSAPQAAAAGLRSTDSRSALVVAHLDGDEDAYADRIAVLQPAFTTTTSAGVRIETGGFAQNIVDMTGQVKKDLARAEAIAIPLTLILLVAVFGSLIAGLLPLMVGVLAMIGTFAVLRLLTAVTDVSVFSLNLTIALGLGLGIDYALLVVNRFREELQAGHDVEPALRTTVRTAGRTVLFSAATIAIALAALLAFPMYFLRSFAYAGIAVVVITATAAVVVLPAVLRLLGHRANRRRFGHRTAAAGDGVWGRIAAAVMRRPVVAAVPVLALLALMALPMASVSFGLPDDRALPAENSQARRVGDVLRQDFSSRESDALVVTLPSTPSGPDVADYARALSRLPHVSRVDAATGTFADGAAVAPGRADLQRGDASAVRVLPEVDVYSDEAQALVRAVRDLPAPGERLVGGPTARFADVNATIGARLPLVAALMALSTLLLIFAFTGSVVLAAKALALNVITIGAVLGAMVWIFQEGHGAGLLGFTATPLSVNIPPLMFCLAFGLSMDYEVFLLGRIAEYHAAGMDTTEAVTAGLARTGRIITAAAALMAVTFAAFATSAVSFIQMLGVGCALAVLLDATLVRGVLVPALMRLMGQWNWWSPAPLRHLHDRFGVAESGDPVDVVHLADRRPVTSGVGGQAG